MNLLQRNIKTDYLSGDPALQSFYKYSPLSPDFEQIIRDKSKDQIPRDALVDVISRQYEGVPITEETRKNIDLLKQGNTFTFTTGHQLCLFGGPMFTAYKVMTVIRLAAEQKQKYPNYNFVPIFWIHTEDHDFEEINHFFTGFGEKQTYPGAFQGKVGTHILESSIGDLVPKHFPETLQSAFVKGKSLARAYRAFMNDLFGKYGLVILDPDEASLKQSFSGVIKAELTEHISKKETTEVDQRLADAGYKRQIFVRDINLFYMNDGLRNRIDTDGEDFQVLDCDLEFSREEMLHLCEVHPEYFSPNVSLRPLYQEMILPNLAYVGGWAEVAYWLQLKGTFEHFKVNFPLVLPRMSATILTEEVAHKWAELGLSTADISLPLHEVNNKYVPKLWDEGDYVNWEGKIEEQMVAFEQYILGMSPTLARSAQAQVVKQRRFMKNMKKKLYRLVRDQHTKPFEELHRLKQAVQPDRTVQERVLSLAAFQHISPHTLLSYIEDACNPLDLSHRYICIPNA